MLKIDHYDSLLGYDNVEWFVDGVINLENKMGFYFRNTDKYFVMSEKDENDFRNRKICRFCEKDLNFVEVRDH